jgi:hypothetical protein
MIPVMCKRVENGFVFEYDPKELELFNAEGKKGAGNGFILKSFINNVSEYFGYGTIEAPMKDGCTMNLKRCEAFDGRFSLDKIMNPDPVVYVPLNHRLIFLDSTDI